MAKEGSQSGKKFHKNESLQIPIIFRTWQNSDYCEKRGKNWGLIGKKICLAIKRFRKRDAKKAGVTKQLKRGREQGFMGLFVLGGSTQQIAPETKSPSKK